MADADRSIATMVSDIIGDLQQIVRAEVRLARVEIREELTKAKRGAVLLLAGGVVVILAFGVGLLAAVYALEEVWPRWAAALAVAAAVAVVGATFAASGIKHIKGVTLPPQKTVSSIRENIQWAKTRAR